MSTIALLRAGMTLFLALWLGALVLAASRLGAWSDEMVHTLLQIRADTTFRLRMAQHKQPISREWYRNKALALIAAGDRIEDDDIWSLAIPGSWHRVDDLRARVQARIEREFSEIAVETLRRELNFRASRLTGVAQDSATGELLPGRGCSPPLAPVRAATGLPELAIVQSQLRDLEELDQAVQDLAALQQAERTDPARLRQLVAYALGTQLPGPLARSAAFLRHSMGAPDPAQVAVRTARLQRAALCSLQQSMAALDERVFERNDLLAAEALLARRTHELFGQRAPQRPYAETVAGWREVIALVGQQEQLLAGGDSGWMMQATAGLGPVHDALLARIAQVGLLGPEAAQLLRRQSADALLRLRRQLVGSFAAGNEPGLVWLQGEGRLALSPQRLALRDELAALLREPFMAPSPERHFADAVTVPLAWDSRRMETALAWAPVRRWFMAERLPKFPAGAQPAVARFVDRQLAARVEQAALEAMSPATVAVNMPLDAAAWRSQRQQLAKVQELLAHLGARAGADRLRALAAGDAARRLTLFDQALAQTPLYSARTRDFGWWQGEGSPILQAFDVADATGLRQVLAQQFSRLDALARQAAALTDASLPGTEPQAARWQGMVAELARYRGGFADSSLLALQRYLVWLAPDLRAANCSEKLAATAALAARGSDEFAQRQRQLHEALVRRCAELRAGGPKAGDSTSAAVPLG